MKSLIPLILAASSITLQAQTAPTPTATPAPATYVKYADALSAAKTAGRNFVVFYEGPEWLQETAQVSRQLGIPAARAFLPGITDWASIQAKTLSDEEMKKLKVKPDFIPYDLPALALVDPEGKTFAAVEGVTPANFQQSMSSLRALLPSRERRDAVFAKARAATGLERAKLFGQGLDQVTFAFAAKAKDIISEIKKADPEDASGYTFKYTFRAGSFHENNTAKLIGEKKQGELLSLVDKHLANPVLLPIQRQALLSAKMQAYRSQEDIPNAVTALRKIIEIDPRSELGVGAVNYIRILTEPVRLRGRKWEESDNRPHWLPMVANVSDVIRESGTYEIEFKHTEGETRFRKVVIKAGGREIANEANPKGSRKVKINIPELPKGQAIELWVESRGTGWFHSRGEIIITKAS